MGVSYYRENQKNVGAFLSRLSTAELQEKLERAAVKRDPKLRESIKNEIARRVKTEDES